MKLFHVADIHLGRRRLDGRLPDEDFVVAFRFIVEKAIEEKTDAFLISGDLFDRAQVEPGHLQQAQAILLLLRHANIPVIAIEGNHDKAFVHSSEKTWMQFLADDDLLVLLRPAFNKDGAVLEPWSDTSRSGSFIDVGGVRFVGAGYLGAATPAKIRQIIARLDDSHPVVMLLHAGPDYFVGEGGGFSKEEIEAIKERVCYLALGHIHRPMMHENWGCNPGSPENCELREAGAKSGNIENRGYAMVEIDPTRPDKPVSIEVRSNPRRPVNRVTLNCTPFGNKTKNGASALIEAAVKEVSKVNPTSEDVIDLILTGKLNLNRIALDQVEASEKIRELAGVFTVALDTTRLNVGDGFAGADGTLADNIPRDQLERRAIRELVEENNVWGLGDQREAFVDFFYDLKEAVRMGKSAEEITDQIATAPLVESIRNAKKIPAAPPPEASTIEGMEVTG